jgi:nucleosome binding factor SPN SPT16 subunit
MATLLFSGCASKPKVIDTHKTYSQAEHDFNTKLQEKTVRDPKMAFLPSKSKQRIAFNREMSATFNDISNFKRTLSKREQAEREKKRRIAQAKQEKIEAKRRAQRKARAERESRRKKQVVSTYYN